MLDERRRVFYCGFAHHFMTKIRSHLFRADATLFPVCILAVGNVPYEKRHTPKPYLFDLCSLP